MSNQKGGSPDKIGEAVRDARRKRKWSQIELAERAGVSRSSVLRVEKGDHTSTKILTKIMLPLGMSLKANAWNLQRS